MRNLMCAAALLLGGCPGVPVVAGEAETGAPAADSADRAVHRLGNEDVIVHGARRDLSREGMLTRDIQPTSVVTGEVMQCRNASNLVQAVAAEPGVDVLTGCSMCGFKEVMVNGLGPERTTVLMDGLPLYSTVTGFYGLDGLTTAGIAAIEVARGPGASLLAPEAIGGAMDVRFRDPVGPFAEADVSAGGNGWRRLSFTAGSALPDGSLGIMVAGHSFSRGQVDADGNGLTESPSLRNESAMLRLNGTFFRDWDWSLRALRSRSEVCGGRTGDACLEAAADDSAPVSFAGGDVRESYLGGTSATTEWVMTTRDEAAGNLAWNSEVGTWQLRGGYAGSRQSSLYEDNADYVGHDRLWTGDLRWQGKAGKHALTVGGDGRYEHMTSDSRHYYQELGMAPDDFNAEFFGIYLQDVRNFGNERDLSLAARTDHAEVRWMAKGDDPQIDDEVFCPRASLRWKFFEGFTGRLSAGAGWRAPLTFFENDHGMLDDGFAIEADALEKAWGAGGSLAWEGRNWNLQTGAYGTAVKNLAYVDGSGEVPTLRSLNARLVFLSLDCEGGVQPFSWLNLGAGVQHQELPDRYRSRAAVAAVETRVSGNARLKKGPAALYFELIWTAPRDLSAYGYGDQYNIYDASTGGTASAKRTHAPGFAVVNLQVSSKIHGPLEVYAGAENLFDYTQTVSGGDSPLFWDRDGGYDVSHIWGPLRGRQFYAGLRWQE